MSDSNSTIKLDLTLLCIWVWILYGLPGKTPAAMFSVGFQAEKREKIDQILVTLPSIFWLNHSPVWFNVCASTCFNWEMGCAGSRNFRFLLINIKHSGALVRDDKQLLLTGNCFLPIAVSFSQGLSESWSPGHQQDFPHISSSHLPLLCLYLSFLPLSTPL